MTKEDLRTKYERIHFEESDNKNGKLKQGYAKWLEDELLEAINYSRCCKSNSEQLKALEDLKDFAYDNCQPHNSDRLSEIMERL